MADYRPLLTLICLISGKPCQIARPLLLKKNVQFQVGIWPEQFQLNQYLLKMPDNFFCISPTASTVFPPAVITVFPHTALK